MAPLADEFVAVGERDAFVRSLRARNWVDVDEAGKSEEDLEAIRQSRANSRAALQLLAEELYQNKGHCLLEILQNADDNVYGAGTEPTASFALTEQSLRFECNEQGLSKANWRSLCSIGQSTKVLPLPLPHPQAILPPVPRASTGLIHTVLHKDEL